MPNYNEQHRFYGGVDLHARSMYLHIVDAKGKASQEKGTQLNGTSIEPVFLRHARMLHAARSGLLFRERVE